MCLPLVPASSTLNVPSRFSSLTRLSTAMRFPKPRLRAASGSVTGLFTGDTGSAMRRNPQRTCRELLLANCNLYATNRASNKVVDRGADEAADVADHSIDERDENDSDPASCTAEWSGDRNHLRTNSAPMTDCNQADSYDADFNAAASFLTSTSGSATSTIS